MPDIPERALADISESVLAQLKHLVESALAPLGPTDARNGDRLGAPDNLRKGILH